MNITTVYVGMDVHKESFSLCCFTIDKEKPEFPPKTPADYRHILKYLEFLRTHYGDDTRFICGYEAGCLGFTLFHQLMDHHVDCVILAPSTMSKKTGKIKTDKRDAEHIARCMAIHDYSKDVLIHSRLNQFVLDRFEYTLWSRTDVSLSICCHDGFW